MYLRVILGAPSTLRMVQRRFFHRCGTLVPSGNNENIVTEKKEVSWNYAQV
jgi:hypothetical protein